MRLKLINVEKLVLIESRALGARADQGQSDGPSKDRYEK